MHCECTEYSSYLSHSLWDEHQFTTSVGEVLLHLHDQLPSYFITSHDLNAILLRSPTWRIHLHSTATTILHPPPERSHCTLLRAREFPTSLGSAMPCFRRTAVECPCTLISKHMERQAEEFMSNILRTEWTLEVELMDGYRNKQTLRVVSWSLLPPRSHSKSFFLRTAQKGIVIVHRIYMYICS